MSPAKTAISPRSSPLRTFRQQPPTQAFLGELVFHPSPQTGRDEKRAPLKTSEWEAISPGATERFFVISMEFLSLMRRRRAKRNGCFHRLQNMSSFWIFNTIKYSLLLLLLQLKKKKNNKTKSIKRHKGILPQVDI